MVEDDRISYREIWPIRAVLTLFLSKPYILVQMRPPVLFEKRIPFKLKSRFFIQKEEVRLNQTLAEQLGCNNILIQPGTYKIRCKRKLKLKVRVD